MACFNFLDFSSSIFFLYVAKQHFLNFKDEPQKHGLLPYFDSFLNIGSPHEFRSELKLPFLCQFDLKQSPFDRPLEIVLNGRNDVEPVLIVPLLELL